ncbi:MAG TPA: DEAD/DEAH box helicase family protein, partial [Acidimicrobiales bacterium]
MVGDAVDWSGLRPRFEWRSSQRHLLALASHVEDRRWHLCAPPGAGKTLIGLELARQVGAPTLILAPTVAIRDQWRASTALFGADPATFTSTDPDTPAPLLAVTYQLLGNPGDAAAELRAAARRLWVAEVRDAGGLDDAEAERRVATTERADPERARREHRRHVRALRRTLTQGGDLGLSRADLLGARPLALVERLAEAGIGCVVLDECHHLLDWWALVVGALVERLEQERPVAVVGLTATLPDPDSSREAENYRGLLGDVDAELQLAAMVADGTVAPWRDGIRIARLTDDEQAFLDVWADRFATELDEHLAGEAFVTWAVG